METEKKSNATSESTKTVEAEVSTFTKRHRNVIVVSTIVLTTHMLGLPVSAMLCVAYFAFSTWFKAMYKQYKADQSNSEPSSIIV